MRELSQAVTEYFNLHLQLHPLLSGLYFGLWIIRLRAFLKTIQTEREINLIFITESSYGAKILELHTPHSTCRQTDEERDGTFCKHTPNYNSTGQKFFH